MLSDFPHVASRDELIFELDLHLGQNELIKLLSCGHLHVLDPKLNKLVDLQNFLDSNWLIFFQSMQITNLLNERYLTPLSFEYVRVCPENNLVAKDNENCAKDIAKSITKVVLEHLLAK